MIIMFKRKLRPFLAFVVVVVVSWIVVILINRKSSNRSANWSAQPYVHSVQHPFDLVFIVQIET